MTKRDRLEFTLYVKTCTDAQVRGVYEKESAAGRKAYAQLALLEAARRGIEIDERPPRRPR